MNVLYPKIIFLSEIFFYLLNVYFQKYKVIKKRLFYSLLLNSKNRKGVRSTFSKSNKHPHHFEFLYRETTANHFLKIVMENIILHFSIFQDIFETDRRLKIATVHSVLSVKSNLLIIKQQQTIDIHYLTPCH